MGDLFPVPVPLTPEWLTVVLHQAAVLKGGRVLAVDASTTGALNSRLSQLRVRYSDDASPTLPTRLVLKRNLPAAWGVEAGLEEVKFYELVASLTDHPPLTVPCLAAGLDERSGESFLLLEDLSLTHAPPVTRSQQIAIMDGVPAPAYVEQVIATLARLHAYWWEHPLIGSGTFEVGYWSRTSERFARYLERRTAAWNALVAAESGWLPDDLRQLYERVLGRLHRHWKRYLEPRFHSRANLTLIHGDAYFANFLCPRDPAAGSTYLLDWQSPTFDLAGYDLVNLLATFWTSEQRHEDRREERILRRYHDLLQQYGVTGYSWDDLVTDYRSGLIFWLLMPVQDRHGGSRKDYWWPKMQCLTSAFREWRCEELLG